jgi:hypothetical protein
MKKCSVCLIEKSLDSFCKNSKLISGRSSHCKLCHNEKNRLRDLLNPLRKAEYNSKWRNENKVAISNHYENNKESISIKIREYQKLNKSKVNAANSKRRASLKSRVPSWLTKEQFKEVEMFYKMANILTKETGIKHHVDHIIPLQGCLVSGLHIPSNLQVITAKDNLSKSNKFTTQ